MKTLRIFAPALALLGAFAMMVGCGGSNGTDSTGGGNGTLAVRMSDGADNSVTAMHVTIPKVEANVNGNWKTIAEPNQTYNLFDLTDSDVLLGSAILPAGNYTQVRLLISAATVTDSTGTHDLVVPSGAQTGLKINVNYAIRANEITEILLDFNVSRSLHVTGNGKYMFKPVVPGVVKILSGTISGNTTDGSLPLAGTQVVAVYTAGSNYTIGTQVNSSQTGATGHFKIWALLPGTYEVDMTYTDPVTLATKTAVVSNVVVTADHNSDVGTVVLN